MVNDGVNEMEIRMRQLNHAKSKVRHLSVDGEDGASRDKSVDGGCTIERIKTHNKGLLSMEFDGGNGGDGKKKK